VNGSNSVALEYDADGLRTRVGDLVITRSAQTGDVTATALGASTEAVSYDAFGAPGAYSATHGGSALFAETHTRDALGRITATTETIGGASRTFAYSYDAAGRLEAVRQDGALVATYAYDANGNRLRVTGPAGNVTAVYDAQDRLVEQGATTYAHTPNGELSSKKSGALTTSYRYDGTGNLTGASLPDGKQIEYLLDGRGRRVGRRVDGALVQAFLYQDGLRPIAELDGAGAVISRFVYADARNVPAYMVKGGATYRLVTDHLGSPRLVVDVATGQVAQRLEYDAFGEVVLDTHPGFQPFGFAGGLYDGDTKLTRFGLRDYDAETGRWTAKDPVGFVSGPNLYVYADDDPVNLVDPLGDNPVDPLGPTGSLGNASTPVSAGDARNMAGAQAQRLRVQMNLAWERANFFKSADAGLFNGSVFRRNSTPFGTNATSGEVGGDFRADLSRGRKGPPPACAPGGVGPMIAFTAGVIAGSYMDQQFDISGSSAGAGARVRSWAEAGGVDPGTSFIAGAIATSQSVNGQIAFYGGGLGSILLAEILD
jgi:RHS repeat-associated protein